LASDVTLPRLSDSMEEGGEVTRGEPLVEIETDKANMTYDADTDGVLVEIVAQEGDTLEIGEVIARIGDAGEAKSSGDGEAEEGDEAEGGDEDSGDAEKESGGDDADSEGDEEKAGDDEEAGDEDEAADEEDAGDEEKEGAVAEGDGDEADADGDEDAGDEEKEGAVAEADGDEDAEGKGADEDEEKAGGEEQGDGDGEVEGDADDEGGDAAAEAGDGDEAAQDDGEDDEAAAEGEEAAVAGAEGGGGETQAGAGTATREKTSTGNGDGRVKASPVARRMARDLGVELAELEGTGPGGRIVKADVQAAAENGGGKSGIAEKGKAEPADGDGDGADATAKDDAEAAKKDKKGKKKDKKADDKTEKKDGAKADGDAEKGARADGDADKGEKADAGVKGHVKVEELTRLQQTVSRRMAESKATAPDFSICLTVDMTAAVALRERLKEISDPVPSFNDMVVKACAGALREHPRVNGAYRDGKFELYDRVNVGIAVAAMDALVVPTVFDADQKSLGQIARDAREVIGKVKDKTVTPPELSGGTFTVSNLGMFGIEQFTAIINPPQAAILTVGKLEKKPAVDDKGKLIARDQMVLTLVCDHRILYGADGAEFLARVKDLLEQPLSLAL